jgi:pyridinium-3,5-biscarboxylic acid mononucleotide sulfurtransferase
VGTETIFCIIAHNSRWIIMNTLSEKQVQLEENLRTMDSVLVAYSGGVDSAYLAWCANRVLGKKMLAVIADSPSLARSQFADALSFARQHAIPLEVIATNEMGNAAYVKNDLQRCFHCKDELFTRMESARARLGFTHLAYGMNLDDQGDFRPGQKAASQHGVLAPLVEAGLSKEDIRQLAREAGLRVWDKPASACLSSRLAYGQEVTRDKLQRIEDAEEFLRGRGFEQFRVRDHGGIARVEIAPKEMARVLSVDLLQTIASEIKAFGFDYVTLDCEGFQSGSMNRVHSSENRGASRAPTQS